jgi:signal transduction histidine kinase
MAASALAHPKSFVSKQSQRVTAVSHTAPALRKDDRIMAPAKILVVVDDEAAAAGIEAGLQSLGHHVSLVQSADDALREVETRWQRQKLESLTILASGVAHDFNNLLTVILGTAGLGIADHEPGTPAYEAFATIKAAADRAAEITSQMLAYAGKGRLFVELTDLNHLVVGACSPPDFAMPANVLLRYELAPDMPRIVADASQLRRVVFQLMRNAVEAIGDAEGTITVATELRRMTSEELATSYLAPELAPGAYALLRVSDSGGGMDAATLARAFEPFFSTKFAGRGLGLSEVLGIVSGHRGTVRVESAAAGGTTCSVLLPAEPPGA